MRRWCWSEDMKAATVRICLSCRILMPGALRHSRRPAPAQSAHAPAWPQPEAGSGTAAGSGASDDFRPQPHPRCRYGEDTSLARCRRRSARNAAAPLALADPFGTSRPPHGLAEDCGRRSAQAVTGSGNADHCRRREPFRRRRPLPRHPSGADARSRHPRRDGSCGQRGRAPGSGPAAPAAWQHAHSRGSRRVPASREPSTRSRCRSAQASSPTPNSTARC